ncbi:MULTISPECIES: cytochrome b [unclassified Endozoicomonas]|uniref:cytochrome b n=1 Tax=unclassified Endozoicomonas TaxID=2644528 RepID=UPI0021485265|nr:MULTISPECIES: cytochrome b [unclassified Endozoicomonas]
MISEKYPVLMRLLHWLMALTILGIIASGWYMAGLSKDVSYKYDIYPWHKSFGILVLLLVVIRILIRLFSKVPKLPKGLPHHEKVLARVTHYSLYALMILVPVSGLTMSDAGGRAVFFFGIPLPELMEDNKELAGTLHTIHTYIPYAFLGIIALHVVGALKHRFMDKPENDVLGRML